MPSTSAPRAPSRPVLVASGLGGMSFRASAISRAVRAAVPDGASALCGWCSSMTSTDSKKRAACWAKCIDSTAPMAKFGAMRTATSGLVRQPLLDLAEALVGESGGADDCVDAVVDQELQVVHHDAGMGEVDDDLGLGVHQLAQRIAGVDAGGERQVVGGLHGLDHRRADLALGAQHSDSHGWQPSCRCRHARGYLWGPRGIY